MDSIILLSLVKLGKALHRMIAVVESRGSKHEFDTREFAVGPDGITLLPIDAGAVLPALPIESCSSVLSRAPTRLGHPRSPVSAPELKDRSTLREGRNPTREWVTVAPTERT